MAASCAHHKGEVYHHHHPGPSAEQRRALQVQPATECLFSKFDFHRPAVACLHDVVVALILKVTQDPRHPLLQLHLVQKVHLRVRSAKGQLAALVDLAAGGTSMRLALPHAHPCWWAVRPALVGRGGRQAGACSSTCRSGTAVGYTGSRS